MPAAVQFNLMVAGHPCAGKSSLLRTIAACADVRSLARDDVFYCAFASTSPLALHAAAANSNPNSININNNTNTSHESSPCDDDVVAARAADAAAAHSAANARIHMTHDHLFFAADPTATPNRLLASSTTGTSPPHLHEQDSQVGDATKNSSTDNVPQLQRENSQIADYIHDARKRRSAMILTQPAGQAVPPIAAPSPAPAIEQRSKPSTLRAVARRLPMLATASSASSSPTDPFASSPMPATPASAAADPMSPLGAPRTPPLLRHVAAPAAEAVSIPPRGYVAASATTNSSSAAVTRNNTPTSPSIRDSPPLLQKQTFTSSTTMTIGSTPSPAYVPQYGTSAAGSAASKDTTGRSTTIRTRTCSKTQRRKPRLKLLPLPEWRRLTVPSIGRLGMEFSSPNWGNLVHLRCIDTPSVALPDFYYTMGSSYGGSLNDDLADDPRMRACMQQTRNVIAAQCDLLDLQFENTLLAELQIHRRGAALTAGGGRGIARHHHLGAPDFLIHCCLYVLDPRVCEAAQGLTPMDIIALSMLTRKVNVILCLGRSDMLPEDSLAVLRTQIQESVTQFKLRLFDFSELPDVSYSEEQMELNRILREMQPFAVMAPTSLELRGGHGFKDTFRIPLDIEVATDPKTGLLRPLEENVELPAIAQPNVCETAVTYTVPSTARIPRLKFHNAAITDGNAITSVNGKSNKGSSGTRNHNIGTRILRSANTPREVVLDVMDPHHSDTCNVISTLFDTHLDDLVSRTRLELYERWRAAKLADIRDAERAVAATNVSASTTAGPTTAAATAAAAAAASTVSAVSTSSTSAKIRSAVPQQSARGSAAVRVVAPAV